MFEIKWMGNTDIEFALRLTNAENWANTQADFGRLVNLNPEGNFVAWVDKRPVGMITSVIFDKLAFIGNLIVENIFRGNGYGRRLMEFAVDYLKTKNISTIELDGDFPAVELYRKLGFKDKYLSLRFERQPEDMKAGIIDKSRKFISDAIFQIDKKLASLNRSDFLGDFIELHKDAVYSLDNSAYAIIRKCYGGRYVIGPAMAETDGTAEKLIRSILNDYGTETIYAGVPEINRKAIEIMLNNNFCYNNPSLRMYLGDKINYEKNIYAIISGDVG